MRGNIFYRFLLALVLLSVLTINLSAQGTTGTLRGRVTDSSNGEVLAFCNIIVDGLDLGASTDRRGYFVLPGITANKLYTLKVSYIGYEKQTVKSFVFPGKITELEIEMVPASFELQTVEKIGERVAEENATDIGLERITIKELESLPRGVETDLFRSLQYLPGVRSSGDVSSKFFVRGGGNNQNLILLDGVVLYNPFHAMGLFSAIDPEIINNVEFYKGGFSSEYGGRLSSVLRVVTKEGNKQRFSGRGSFSYLATKAMVEGPITGGSFYLSGRKSYSSSILKKFLNDKTVPVDFYDLSFKLNYSNFDFIENAFFAIHGFVSQDKINNEDIRLENYEWKTSSLGFKWLQIGMDAPLYFEVNAYFSLFSGKVIPNESQVRYKLNEIKDFSITSDFSYVFDSKDELGVGIHIKEIHTKLDIETLHSDIEKTNANGVNFVTYLKYKLLRFENFGADVGTRLNLTRLAVGTSTEYLLEPRLSITYRILPNVAFKSAFGVYNQELTTITDENEILNIFEPWIIAPYYLEPSQAIHYIAGFDIDFTDSFAMDVEAYYKKLNNITTVNNMKIYENDPELVAGNGKAYGLDLSASYKFTDVNLAATYSYGWIEYEANGEKYHPRFDARHAVNCSMEINLGAGWKTSLIWIYHSGQPFTKIYGYYDKLNPTEDIMNSIFKGYLPYSILGEKNGGRLPQYHRLDFSLSKKFEIRSLQFAFDFSIVNVYDRENIFYYRRDTGERVNMLPFLPTATLKVIL